LHALRRRWLTAAGLAAGGTVAVVLLVMQLVPSVYTAEARLQVVSRSPDAALLEPGEPAPDHSITKTNQEAMIKSVPVLNAALNRPEVQGLPAIRNEVNPTGWLEKNLKVEFKGAEILQLSMTG